jgi:CBS domain-containing protein
MKRVPVQLSPEDPAYWIQGVMDDHGACHLPVTAGGVLLGVISRAECVAASLSGAPGYLTALDFMRGDPAKLYPDLPLGQVARALIEGAHDCLPVVSRRDEFLGSIAVHDVLKHLHRIAERGEGGFGRGPRAVAA